ncbi:MAG: PAS domain-containing sensor histidine kinase [Anaerolineae bacterium]|nr:PAS domain-containing sensor histidine kinase [Anaerolineae bacterium]
MISLLIFAAQLLLFGALAAYLHYRSEDFGLAPLLFYVAGLMGALNLISLLAFNIDVAPGIVIRPGGHVFVPIILFIVLTVYITSGTRSARLTIGGLIGIDVLIVCSLLFLALYLQFQDPSTTIGGLFVDEDILTPLFLRGVAASVITFAANMFVIVIIYQGIKNAFPTFPASLIPGIALLSALWVDAILYHLLAFLGTPQFAAGIPGDILMKTLAGLLLAPLAGWYLTRVAPNAPHYVGPAKRSTLDIVFGEGQDAEHIAQLEDELRVSRAIYEQLTQHIEEIFWLADVKRERLLYLSPNFEKMTGQSPEDFYHNPRALVELVHPDDRGQDMIRAVLLSPEMEFRIQREDGSVRWLRNRSFPIVTQNHQVVRYAGITEDVTTRREAQAQAFALELSREKVNVLHRFVRDASHDLRTPLTSILLKLDMLEKASAERKRQLEHDLREAAQHLNSLIDDLFTLSRIESEEQPAPVKVEFNAIVRKVTDHHRVIAQNKNLGLDVTLAEQQIVIRGNQDQLFRLVANLVENAIYYTDQGSVAVTTRVNGDHASLEVTDTGIGIPEADLEQVFERFYRTDEARHMRQEGTGLGLAIARAVVEQHRGSLTAASAEGRGTTFRVSFPLAGSETQSIHTK